MKSGTELALSNGDERRTAVFGYLSDLNKSMVDAHRHKETLCWGIAAFYALGTVQVLTELSGKGASLASRIALATIYVLVSLILLTYIRRQFNLRDYYVRMSATTSLLVLECLAGDLDDLTPHDLVPTRAASRDSDGDQGLRQAPLMGIAKRMGQPLSQAWRFVFPSRMPIDHFKDHYPPFVIDRARRQDSQQTARKYGLRRIYDLPYDLMVVVGCACVVSIFLRQ